MKTTRKRYGSDFKAKVALEAVRGDLTLDEQAPKHGVHHTMIVSWKRKAIDGIASGLSPGLPPPTSRAVSPIDAHSWA